MGLLYNSPKRETSEFFAIACDRSLLVVSSMRIVFIYNLLTVGLATRASNDHIN